MGDYILFSDQKTVPSPDALFWMIKAVTEKKADMIYTDEDEVSTDGKHHYDPKFKPDFNLFRLRENNYIGQFWAIRRDVLEQSGKFRPEYDGAQNFDMILRCCELAKKSCIFQESSATAWKMKTENLTNSRKPARQEEEHWKIIITEHSFRQLQSKQIKQDGTELIWQFSQSR